MFKWLGGGVTGASASVANLTNVFLFLVGRWSDPNVVRVVCVCVQRVHAYVCQPVLLCE